MKKIKLLPSILTLVLCIGVLAVGVLAFNPISNSVGGTISVSAGKASIAITGYVDGTEVYPRAELNGGIDWTIDSSKLNFDASGYLFASQVPTKQIKLKIENLSNVPYGVFFCDTAGINATSSNIKTAGEVKSGTTTIANASMDYYKYISVADSSTTFDQAEMIITLSVANLSTSSQSGSFKYYLNVEEYDPSLNTTEELIKVSDDITAIEASAYAGNTNIKNVIIPNTIIEVRANAFDGCTGIEDISIPSSITTIGAGAFANCTSLTEITIPASVTSIGAGAFDGCTALQKIIVEAHSTSGNFEGSPILPEFENNSWYLNGVYVTTMAYSTDENVYVIGEECTVRTITVTYSLSGVVQEATAEVSGGREYEIGKFVTLTLTSKDSSYDLVSAGIYGYDKTTSSWVYIENIYDVGLETISYTFELKATSYTEYKFSAYFEPGIL